MIMNLLNELHCSLSCLETWKIIFIISPLIKLEFINTKQIKGVKIGCVSRRHQDDTVNLHRGSL